MNTSIGSSKGGLSGVVSTWDSEKNASGAEIRVDLFLNSNYSKSHFQQLLEQKDAIEAEMGTALQWYDPKNKKVCRVYLRNPLDFRKKEQWPVQHQWMADTLLKFKKVFAERVKNLSDQSINAQTPDEGDGTSESEAQS